MMGRLSKRLRAYTPRDSGVAYAIAIGLVGAAVLVRILLQSVFGSSYAYTAFYPAVILAADLAGRRSGLLATALSGGVAYWFFVEPRLELKLTPQGFGPLVFFAANGAVAVYLIAGLADALERLRQHQRRTEAAARQNADLFRELSERMTHHLQLVSGVLALQAQGEPELKVAEALAKASQTSLLLVHAHRDVSGRSREWIDFAPFAQQLLGAKLASRGLRPDTVELTGDDLRLPPEQATSLGVALLECLGVLLARRTRERLRLGFSRRGDDVVLRISELDIPSGATMARLSEGYLLRAVIEQLEASVTISANFDGGALEILFPQPPTCGWLDEGARESVTLH